MLRTCADRVCVKSSLQHVQICPADLLRFGGVLARELAHTTRFFLSTLGPGDGPAEDALRQELMMSAQLRATAWTAVRKTPHTLSNSL